MQPWYINLNRNRRDPHDFRNDNITEMIAHFEETGHWNPSILTSAAILGRDDIIRFALDHGCPLAEEYLSLPYAALMKKLQCVQLLHERGYPMNQECANYAARGGDLACLEYVVNNGAPLTSNTFEEATDNPQDNILDYLIEKKCPFTVQALRSALSLKQIPRVKQMLQYEPSFDITPCLQSFNRIASELDFSDPYWRELLFVHDLRPFGTLQEKKIVYQHVEEFEKNAYRVITSLVLDGQLNKDVLKYIVLKYI